MRDLRSPFRRQTTPEETTVLLSAATCRLLARELAAETAHEDAEAALLRALRAFESADGPEGLRLVTLGSADVLPVCRRLAERMWARPEHDLVHEAVQAAVEDILSAYRRGLGRHRHARTGRPSRLAR